MSHSEQSTYQGGNRISDGHLDWAKMCARAGEYEAALESLQAAIAAGYSDTWWWAEDEDLKELAGDERFRELIEQGAGELVGV